AAAAGTDAGAPAAPASAGAAADADAGRGVGPDGQGEPEPGPLRDGPTTDAPGAGWRPHPPTGHHAAGATHPARPTPGGRRARGRPGAGAPTRPPNLLRCFGPGARKGAAGPDGVREFVTFLRGAGAVCASPIMGSVGMDDSEELAGLLGHAAGPPAVRE